MATVPLNKGLVAIVDDDDLDAVNNAGRWYAVRKESGFYACRAFGKNDRTYLHRWLLSPAPGLVVDHINGNTLDNRRENLRAVSQANNIRNRAGCQSNSKSGVRGVYWHAQRGKWAAKARENRKNIHLGLFATIEDAKAARLAHEAAHWSPEDRYRAMIAAAQEQKP